MKPDVQIAEEDAFDKACDLAKEAASEYRKKDVEAKVALHNKFEEELSGIEKILHENKEKTEQIASNAFKLALENGLLDQSKIIILGMDYLNKKNNAKMAIFVLKYSVSAYPNSAGHMIFSVMLI